MSTKRPSRHLHKRGRSAGSGSVSSQSHDRKDLQLCRQVAETLSLVLGDCGDDCLRDLHVVRVLPAPDASQLLVIVGSPPGETPAAPREVLERLQARAPAFRAEVAHAITRKRAPSFLFEYLATAGAGHGEAEGREEEEGE